MLLKNKARRLITVNSPSTKSGPGKSYKILPAGPAVEVPDAVCKCSFVKALLTCGDLTECESAVAVPPTAEA